MTGREHPRRPMLRIVRGAPTEQEIAALVTALFAASANQDEAGPVRPSSQWAAPARLTRPQVSASGWWASALPR